MKIIKWILILLLGTFLVTFSLHNREVIVISFPLLEYSLEAPAFLVYFIILIIGFVVGGGVSLIHKIKNSFFIGADKKRISTLEKEVSSLKKSKIVDSTATKE